jgi:hypothetical protein
MTGGGAVHVVQWEDEVRCPRCGSEHYRVVNRRARKHMHKGIEMRAILLCYCNNIPDCAIRWVAHIPLMPKPPVP